MQLDWTLLAYSRGDNLRPYLRFGRYTLTISFNIYFELSFYSCGAGVELLNNWQLGSSKRLTPFASGSSSFSNKTFQNQIEPQSILVAIGLPLLTIGENGLLCLDLPA